MMSDHAMLEPIDAAEITILVDNSVDMLLPMKQTEVLESSLA